MGNYIHFTEEEKYRANNVDLIDFLHRQGEKLIASGREKRLASDRSITIRVNEWYDHSKERGGYAIDFVKDFYNLSFPDAVILLLGGEQDIEYTPAKKKRQEEPKHFKLLNAHSDMRRVYAYLVKTRKIDRDVVSFFAKEKLLYESCEKSKDGSKKYHNAVFVGLDENGVPRHAHKRGLYTEGISFKGNVDGCNPAYSFHWVGKSEMLYVFEAPIDLLSYISLHPEKWQQHSYVALCGVGSQAMMKMLELNSHIQEVALCLDNDEAGYKASERFKKQLAESGYGCRPIMSQGKDWNDDLIDSQQIKNSFEMKMA